MERAIRWERDNLALAAGSTAEHPLGLWIRNRDQPQMWAMNQLYVEGRRPELTAEGLCTELDRGLAGASHRQAAVTDDATGRRIADDMRSAGFSATSLGVLLLDREPPGPDPARPAREITEEEHRALEARLHAAEPRIPVADRPIVLEGHAHMRATIPGTRSFAGLAGDEPVCQTTLFCHGGVGQPEDVGTLPEHRGKGVAAAAVSLATREALVAGSDLVFILCSLSDGPLALYSQLGFRAAGRFWTFNRPVS